MPRSAHVDRSVRQKRPRGHTRANPLRVERSVNGLGDSGGGPASSPNTTPRLPPAAAAASATTCGTGDRTPGSFMALAIARPARRPRWWRRSPTRRAEMKMRGAPPARHCGNETPGVSPGRSRRSHEAHGHPSGLCSARRKEGG
ncbi:hypothetical protein A176_007331 [Myxococcus hansupus]|uniref:Uncharacterized protein n=1 Tax=Pseudomyxococcus hansupus TaxID=1297742 RepID=A0A0H4X597_9BACT|nr:hypothetical protein A176_007331 [Myxococcus hansupus]